MREKKLIFVRGLAVADKWWYGSKIRLFYAVDANGLSPYYLSRMPESSGPRAVALVLVLLLTRKDRLNCEFELVIMVSTRCDGDPISI